MQQNVLIKGLVLVLLTIVISSAGVSAQYNFMGGLHFNGGYPQGDFKDQLDRNAYGAGAQFFYSPSRSPFAIGVELGVKNYGNEDRRERFSTTIPDVTVKVETSNNMVDGFLILRGQVPNGPIRPYVDGLVGFNYLFTETKISDASDGDKVASSTNQDDAVFAYGAGGGVMVRVYDGGNSEGKKPFQILLDAGVRYVIGGEAKYLKEGSIRREGGNVTYDLIESKTDMLRLHVGVVGRF